MDRNLRIICAITYIMKVFLDWGAEGMEAAVARGDIIALIDVLRFTSAAVTAVNSDFTVFPARNDQHAKALALECNACLNGEGLGALSPGSFIRKKPCRVVLPSPHGATLCFNAVHAKGLFIASFLNLSAVSKTLQAAIEFSGQSISIIPSGEIRSSEMDPIPDFEHRLGTGNKIFCFEDYICAGAISHALRAKKTDALLRAEKEFLLHSKNLENSLLSCASGKYLVDCGFAADVKFCSQLDRFSVVPVVSECSPYLTISKRRDDD
ncbi:MAG: 2-phosphosulfolactate phosphatase [Candidatus Micrarchaeota archaeon]